MNKDKENSGATPRRSMEAGQVVPADAAPHVAREQSQLSTQDEWQSQLGWPALRSALTYADGYIGALRHTEAVSDCPHCNFGYIVAWVKKQIGSGTEPHQRSERVTGQER